MSLIKSPTNVSKPDLENQSKNSDEQYNKFQDEQDSDSESPTLHREMDSPDRLSMGGFSNKLTIEDLPDNLIEIIREGVLDGIEQKINKIQQDLDNNKEETQEDLKIAFDSYENKMKEISQSIELLKNAIDDRMKVIESNQAVSKQIVDPKEDQMNQNKVMLSEEFKNELESTNKQLGEIKKKYEKLEKIFTELANVKKDVSDNQGKIEKKIEKMNKETEEKIKLSDSSIEKLRKEYLGNKTSIEEKFQSTQKSTMNSMKEKISKLRLGLMKNEKKLNRIKQYTVAHFFRLIHTTNLDGDAYLYTSATLTYGLLFLIVWILITIIIFVVIPFIGLFQLVTGRRGNLPSTEKLGNFIMSFLQIFLLLLVFLLLSLPGILVVFTQTVCILELWNYAITAESSVDTAGMFILKIFIEIFFFFMISNEISAAVDSATFLFLNKTGSDDPFSRYAIQYLRILPQCVQIFYAFWISYINIDLITAIDSPVDLIQNFAGLLILLEFDNFVLIFLSNMDLYFYLESFLEMIDDNMAEQIKKKMTKKQKQEIKRKNLSKKKVKSMRKFNLKQANYFNLKQFTQMTIR